jgi:Flp pilus assembly protein TadG
MYKRWSIKKKNGQSMVETALVLPVILFIMLGIVDFGFLFNNYLVIDNASREGARSAAVGSSDSVINSTVTSIAASLDQSKLKTTINPPEDERTKGSEVTITVEYDYSLLTPIIGVVIPNPVHLTANTVMRVE